MDLMEFTDTHTHLFSDEFMDDQQGAINRALKAKVKTMLLPNIDVESIASLKNFAEMAPENCYPMMGLHPCSVNADYKNVLAVIREELYSSYRYYGVGEIGLDYHWDKTYIEQQKEAFIMQCEWAVELGLPISIHTRSATYDVIRCLKSMNKRPGGVFHCFGGSKEEADEIIKLGYSLGIGGVVTFKNSSLPEILKSIPLGHIVMETDSPYLSPVPYRGKRNESAYIPYIAEKLSEIYGVSVFKIGEITTANARNIFPVK